MNFNVAMSALINGEVDYTMIFGSVVRAAMRNSGQGSGGFNR